VAPGKSQWMVPSPAGVFCCPSGRDPFRWDFVFKPLLGAVKERKPAMSFQPKTLTCVECGEQFTFTVEEQEFHSKKGYANEPKRCPTCREARRREGGGGGRGPGGGGGGGGYGGGGGGGAARGNRPLFKTTCAGCGGEAEVPFEPKHDRPVYCYTCFKKQRDSGGGGGGRY